MKKLKKNVKLIKTSAWDAKFNAIQFSDGTKTNLSIFKTTNTCMLLKANHNNLSYNDSRRTFKSFWAPTKLKYRFVGKSYRLRNKPNIMFLRFNKAHKTHLLHNKNKVEYFKNKGFLLRSWKNKKEIFFFKRTLDLIRGRNIFTSRGLWNKKDFYLKKKGKVSGYR